LFFANTFPLAYHYAWALKKEGIDPKEKIHIGLWKDSEDTNLIHYTNVPSKTKAQIFVTVFNPRWSFASLTLATSRIWDSIQPRGCPQPKDMSEFFSNANSAGFDDLWIYAELGDLGIFQAKLAQTFFPNPKIFFWQASPADGRLPAFEDRQADHNVLRLFIFGGSMSSYLLRKTSRYLPLSLPGVNNGGRLPSSMELLVSGPEQAMPSLTRYHSALYGTALVPPSSESETCPPFYTVYRSYNELAWLLQHRSSFKSAEEFRSCLAQHHVDQRGKSGAS
jgi:hypothetical protein